MIKEKNYAMIKTMVEHGISVKYEVQLQEWEKKRKDIIIKVFIIGFMCI